MVVRSTVDLEGRRQALAELLSSSGSLRIEDLATRFKVSTMTIRRDLQALEDDGLVRRVRGGAVSGAEPFEAREHRAGRAKQQIAAKLATLVPSGGFGVCMDASSTVCTLAASMPAADNLSVVTDGIETFVTLSRDPRVHAYLTGGQKDPNAGSLIGPVASSVLKQFSFARAFLSAAAVDPYFGTSEFSAEECEIKRLDGGALRPCGRGRRLPQAGHRRSGAVPPVGWGRPDGHRAGGRRRTPGPLPRARRAALTLLDPAFLTVAVSARVPSWS